MLGHLTERSCLLESDIYGGRQSSWLSSRSNGTRFSLNFLAHIENVVKGLQGKSDIHSLPTPIRATNDPRTTYRRKTPSTVLWCTTQRTLHAVVERGRVGDAVVASVLIYSSNVIRIWIYCKENSFSKMARAKRWAGGVPELFLLHGGY